MKKNLHDPLIQRVMMAFGFKKVQDIARYYDTTPQNINGRIKRNTLLNLIRPEMMKRGINIQWLETGHGDMKAVALPSDPLIASLLLNIKLMSDRLDAQGRHIDRVCNALENFANTGDMMPLKHLSDTG